MAGILSSIDEHGLITNTISNGMGMSFQSLLFEKIDNCIDANAKNINIIFDKIECYIVYRGKKIKVVKNVFVVSDDGKGMNEDDGSLKSLISLFNINKKKDINGIYGIGSIASDLAIVNSMKEKKDIFTIYFTRSIDSEQDYEIIIPWEYIFSDKSNSTWSNKVNVNNISQLNNILFSKYRLNNTNGTIVINFFDDFYIQNINFLEINYLIKKYYYKSLKNGLEIKLSSNLLDIKNNYIINSNNNTDVLSINKIKKDSKLGCYVESIVECYYNSEKDNYCYKFKISDYQLGKTKIDKDSCIRYIYPLSNQTFPRNLIVDFDCEGCKKIGEFKLDISLVTKQLIIDDENLMKKAFGKSSTLEYTGLYFERNGRVLSKPIPIWNLRNTQSGNYWRSKLTWNNNINLDNLIKPQLNKSQLNPQNIEKSLFRGISLFIKGIYGPYFKQIIEKKKNCNDLIIKELFKSKPELEKVKKITVTKNTKNNNKVDKEVESSREEYLDANEDDDEDDDEEDDEDDEDDDDEDFEDDEDDVEDEDDREDEKDEEDKKDISKLIRRKNFSNGQVISVLKSQRNRCAVLDIEFDDFLNPYDKDHKDNDSSNNDDSNLQLLSIIAHRHKTLKNQSINNTNYENMNNNKGLFIANMINSLSKSNHFRKLLKSGSISFKANEYDNDGILNVSV